MDPWNVYVHVVTATTVTSPELRVNWAAQHGVGNANCRHADRHLHIRVLSGALNLTTGIFTIALLTAILTMLLTVTKNSNTTSRSCV
jgi:hypothetical protein